MPGTQTTHPQVWKYRVIVAAAAGDGSELVTERREPVCEVVALGGIIHPAR